MKHGLKPYHKNTMIKLTNKRPNVKKANIKIPTLLGVVLAVLVIVSVVGEGVYARVAEDPLQAQQTTTQFAPQITSRGPTAQEADEQIQNTLDEAKGAQRDYRLGWVGLAIFVLGGLFLLYRIIKLR
jgi:hypothetical protein